MVLKIRTRSDKSTGSKKSTRKGFRVDVAEYGNFRAFFSAHHEQVEVVKDGKTVKVWQPTGQLSLRLAIMGGYPTEISWNHQGKGPLATLAAGLTDLAKTLTDATTAWDDDACYSEAQTALDAFLALTEEVEEVAEQPAPTAPTASTQPAPTAPKARNTGIVVGRK